MRQKIQTREENYQGSVYSVLLINTKNPKENSSVSFVDAETAINKMNEWKSWDIQSGCTIINEYENRYTAKHKDGKIIITQVVVSEIYKQ